MAKFKAASLYLNEEGYWCVLFDDGEGHVPSWKHHGACRAIHMNWSLEEAINYISRLLRPTLSEVFVIDNKYQRSGAVRIKRSGENFDAFSIKTKAEQVQARFDKQIAAL